MENLINVSNVLSMDKKFQLLIDNFINNNEIIIGKVHSIFKNTINFMDFHDKMYTIMREDLDNAPYSMRISGNLPLNDLDIGIHDSVIIKGGLLFIGDALSIRLDMYNIWEPEKISICPTPETISIFNRNLDIYNEAMLLNGTYGGCKYLYLKHYTSISQDYRPSFIEEALENRVCSLIECLDNERSSLGDNVKSIIGLGNGLTPSGDDVLTGLILSLSMIQNSKSQIALKNILQSLKNISFDTTDVSVAMLSAAMEGMTRENIYRFIHELCISNIQNDTIDSIFSIGSSSGTDMSAGVVMGLRYGFHM